MTTLDTFTHRAHRHAYEDGLPEILIGVLLAAAAVIVDSASGGRLPSLLGPAMILMAVILPWALRGLRNRFTAPRAGYAELPVAPARQARGVGLYILGAAVIAAALAAAAGDLTDRNAIYRWVPAFFGVAVSGGFLYAAGVSGLRRFYTYAIAAPAGGLVLALTSAPERAAGIARLGILLWVLAGLALVIGGVVFVSFMRHNPVAAAVEEASHGK